MGGGSRSTFVGVEPKFVDLGVGARSEIDETHPEPSLLDAHR